MVLSVVCSIRHLSSFDRSQKSALLCGQIIGTKKELEKTLLFGFAPLTCYTLNRLSFIILIQAYSTVYISGYVNSKSFI